MKPNSSRQKYAYNITFPQPINPKMGGIRQVLPMQSITLPDGQTVQIPKINEQEINANLQSAGITPKMPRPTAMGAGLGRMFDSPMMTASALESTGVTPQSFLVVFWVKEHPHKQLHLWIWAIQLHKQLAHLQELQQPQQH